MLRSKPRRCLAQTGPVPDAQIQTKERCSAQMGPLPAALIRARRRLVLAVHSLYGPVPRIWCPLMCAHSKHALGMLVQRQGAARCSTCNVHAEASWYNAHCPQHTQAVASKRSMASDGCGLCI